MPPGFHRRRHDAFPKDVRTDHLAPPPNQAICLRHRCKRRASVTPPQDDLRFEDLLPHIAIASCPAMRSRRPANVLLPNSPSLRPGDGTASQSQAAVRSGSPVARCECFAGLSHPYRPTVVIASGRTRRSRSETKLPLVRDCPQSDAPALHWDDRWAAGRNGDRPASAWERPTGRTGPEEPREEQADPTPPVLELLIVGCGWRSDTGSDVESGLP